MERLSQSSRRNTLGQRLLLHTHGYVDRTPQDAHACVFVRGERAGFRGEFWAAQAAGTYFVAVLQTLNPATGDGIRSIGGWGEVYYKLNDCTTCYVGYGIDDPRNQDLGFLTAGPDPNDPGQRTLNQVAWGSVLWDVTDFFQLGFEVSHRQTDYVNPFAGTDGMVYHFASTLKY